MTSRRVFWLSLFAGIVFSTAGWSQSPGVLYTWGGTGNVHDWFKNFGTNAVTLSNAVAGELTITETGTAGTGVAVSDGFNRIREDVTVGAGGLDLTGLSQIEIDMGHNGAAAVNVQVFVQASPASTFVALGGDIPIASGVATYTFSLGGLTSGQRAFIRTIGINIRDHVEQGNLVWTIREVRSAGVPLGTRNLATHDPGSSDNGLQGAIVNFDNSAVQGNDGGQNQTGLSQNLSAPPPGNSGSLHWRDLAAGNGAAVTWGNGTVYSGNTFNERPTDLSNYGYVTLRIAATNVAEPGAASVDVQYFLQTGNFNFQAAGVQPLTADGQFHELTFPLAAITDLHVVMQHGVNLGAHAAGDLVIDIDNLRFSQSPPAAQAPAAEEVFLALLVIGTLLIGLALLRRPPFRRPVPLAASAAPGAGAPSSGRGMGR